jgi:hypothetical protein
MEKLTVQSPDSKLQPGQCEALTKFMGQVDPLVDKAKKSIKDGTYGEVAENLYHVALAYVSAYQAVVSWAEESGK